MESCQKIMDDYDYVNDEDWEPNDDCDGSDLSWDVYNWAKRTYDNAESWLHNCSSFTSINGGEDW